MVWIIALAILAFWYWRAKRDHEALLELKANRDTAVTALLGGEGAGPRPSRPYGLHRSLRASRRDTNLSLDFGISGRGRPACPLGRPEMAISDLAPTRS
jgi:hypothetical protein